MHSIERTGTVADLHVVEAVRVLHHVAVAPVRARRIGHGADACINGRQCSCFERFPSVCSEPVLVKRMIMSISKKVVTNAVVFLTALRALQVHRSEVQVHRATAGCADADGAVEVVFVAVLGGASAALRAVLHLRIERTVPEIKLRQGESSGNTRRRRRRSRTAQLTLAPLPSSCSTP
jgi:hypothetical protein